MCASQNQISVPAGYVEHREHLEVHVEHIHLGRPSVVKMEVD